MYIPCFCWPHQHISLVPEWEILKIFKGIPVLKPFNLQSWIFSHNLTPAKEDQHGTWRLGKRYHILFWRIMSTTTTEKSFLCIMTWAAEITVYDTGQEERMYFCLDAHPHPLTQTLQDFRTDLAVRSACAGFCSCVTSPEVQWDCALFQHLETLLQCLEFLSLKNI